MCMYTHIMFLEVFFLGWVSRRLLDSNGFRGRIRLLEAEAKNLKHGRESGI